MKVKVGDTFNAPHADSEFTWTVREVSGRYVLADMDDPHDWGHVERAFLVTEVETCMRWDAQRRAHFDRQADFWATVTVGRTLHYHNGFGEFVRGIVVEDVHGKRELQPTALVGVWDHHWEYHWAKVVRGDGAFQPSVSCIVEAPEFAGIHPRWNLTAEDVPNLPPLDLSSREEGNAYFKHCMAQSQAS